MVGDLIVDAVVYVPLSRLTGASKWLDMLENGAISLAALRYWESWWLRVESE